MVLERAAPDREVLQPVAEIGVRSIHTSSGCGRLLLPR